VINLNEFLSNPLQVALGQPLRVAVYSKLAEAIRTGIIPLGVMLPRESELCLKMGVSRTVIREALMLLEEDGLLVTKRGIGRFVSTRLPSPGLENITSPELLLSGDSESLSIRRIESYLQKPSDLTIEVLNLESASDSWFCESLIYRDGKCIALIQEHLPAGERLNEVHPQLGHIIETNKQPSKSILSILTELLDKPLVPGLCHIQAGVPGHDRSAKMDLQKNSPVLIITQSLSYKDKPAYLAKYIINSSEKIIINQAIQS